MIDRDPTEYPALRNIEYPSETPNSSYAKISQNLVGSAHLFQLSNPIENLQPSVALSCPM